MTKRCLHNVIVGSTEHKELFCRSFLDTHRAFEPTELPWPQLEPQHIELLRSFPFWAFALSMEREAGRMITEFSRTVYDPLIREAIELQAFEEARHGRLLHTMLTRYDVSLPTIPLSQKPVGRDDFLTFGFSECLDSLVGFGGFALARQKEIFPAALLDIFEQVLFEEARHIVFFINYWRYQEAASGRNNPLTRLARAIQYSVKAMMHTAQGAQGAAVAPSATDLAGGGSQAILEGVTPKMFLQIALAENRKMMDRIDKRLLRPKIVPTIATAALIGLGLLPPRKAAAVERG